MNLIGDNRQVYSGSEFERWAHRSKLELGEPYMVSEVLKADRRTFEAGCGGGRLLLELQSRGFKDLHGFDYLPEFIDVARERDQQKTINYSVQNAIAMDYEDESFDQAIYLQQVLCFLESEDDRKRAVREAFRVLRPGGTIIASFLAYRSRVQSLLGRVSLAYFYSLRTILGRRISMQYWPWLRRGNVFNLGALLDKGPYTYWIRSGEAAELFTDAGFKLVGIASDAQIAEGRMVESAESLDRESFRGGLYVVCEKPA